MDGLTAHYLARELHERWRGRRVATLALDRARLGVVISVAGAPAVRIDLAARDPLARGERTPAPGGIVEGWTVAGVEAPEDDRRLVVRFEKEGKFRGSPSRSAVLEISLVPSARGVVLRDEAGHRMATAGSPLPAPLVPRPVLAPDAVAAAARAHDLEALKGGRWMSGWLSAWLIAEPAHAATRYAEVCALPAARPSRCGDRLLPLPACADPVSADSLVESEEREKPAPRSRSRDPSSARERALARMRRELARAAAAPRVREIADALIALGDSGDAPREVTLAGGTTAAVDGRHGESAVAVAERLYREARSMERALDVLPARIATLTAAPAPPSPLPRTGEGGQRSAAAGAPCEPSRVYRVYRSSGGLEIWV
ncbi:MAG: hypothetical protein M3373_10610, partial [Gemmatimonadota bacterium]|nr:hypothetical protein [Gemmatimonadota bacterium]